MTMCPCIRDRQREDATRNRTGRKAAKGDAGPTLVMVVMNAMMMMMTGLKSEQLVRVLRAPSLFHTHTYRRNYGKQRRIGPRHWREQTPNCVCWKGSGKSTMYVLHGCTLWESIAGVVILGFGKSNSHRHGDDFACPRRCWRAGCPTRQTHGKVYQSSS